MQTTKRSHSLISGFAVRYLDSIIPIPAKFKLSRLKLVSVAEQAGLSLTWSKLPKTGFLVTWLILFMNVCCISILPPANCVFVGGGGVYCFQVHPSVRNVLVFQYLEKAMTEFFASALLSFVIWLCRRLTDKQEEISTLTISYKRVWCWRR